MPEFVSFNQHRDRLHDARLGAEVDRAFPGAEARAEPMASFGGARASRATRKDKYAAELDKVLAYLRGYYRPDAAARHTFQDEQGNFVDCVPFADVPTVRAAREAGHGAVADRAPPPRGFEVRTEKRGLERPPTPARVVPPLRRGLVDRFGNRLACPDGCVPIARLAPDDITRTGSFAKFFEKMHGPTDTKKGAKKGGKKAAAKPAARTRKVVAPTAPVAPAVQGHMYANTIDTTGGQYFGCSTGLSVWQPRVPSGTTSISQLWMTGAQNVSARGPQSVESGWFVYDFISGVNTPVLFVYFNPDGYMSVEEGGRSGYVTNASHQGFVPAPDPVFVVNHQGFLLPSGPGADPAGIQLYWEFTGGATPGCYLYYGAIGDDPSTYHYLGYFPSFLYGNTELATHCSFVQFGGEVGGLTQPGLVTNPPGFTEMGSGTRPTADAAFNYRNVAFQCDLYVSTTNAPNAPMSVARLRENVVNRDAGFDLNFPADPAFARYFFFGGRAAL